MGSRYLLANRDICSVSTFGNRVGVLIQYEGILSFFQMITDDSANGDNTLIFNSLTSFSAFTISIGETKVDDDLLRKGAHGEGRRQRATDLIMGMRRLNVI